MSTAYRLLAILAHPDDESFGTGGTLAHYTARGVEVHYLCMTDGASGTVEPQFLEDYDSITELRAAELACASEQLGLASHFFSGYRDSGMAGSEDNTLPDALANQPVEEVAAVVAHHIRRIKPQVVITHDPIGGYMHPDHIMSNRATTLAFELAGDAEALPDEPLPAYQPQKLYYSTFSKRFLKFLIIMLKLFRRDPSKFGRNQDLDLQDLVEAGDFPIHARIPIRAALPVRDAASDCHASQLGGGPPNSGIAGQLLRLFFRSENFMLAVPAQAPEQIERDLFTGVQA
jgi:LmbE family N-acetylglucosaminyl deacetylase